MTGKIISFVFLLSLGLGSLGCGSNTAQQAIEQDNAFKLPRIQATEPTPEPAIAYSRRCRADYQQGQFDEAVADCSRAIELDPKAADAYLHRGLALKDKGQKSQAVRDLETFLLLSDNPVDRVQVERLISNLK